MSKPLQTASVVAPAFLGLNTQDSGVAMDEGFALEATNCVIDKYGRLGARKGWRYRTTALDGVTDDNIGVDLKGMHIFLDLAGVKTNITWSDTEFYTGYEDLLTTSPTTTDTLLAGKWQSATLNDRAYFFQRGYEPLVYTNDTTPKEFDTVVGHTGAVGIPPKANVVLSAYGRLWAADTANNKTTVYFSDLLDGTNWLTGTAGSLNIAGTFAKDSDSITGLGAHNGKLIIFCTNSIIIYGDNDGFQTSVDVTTLTLVESIVGIGCISRDSIQGTGEDILFLSSTGVRSLGRTIQEKSQPFRDISKNIRNDLLQYVENEADSNNIKAVYSPSNAFYLLAFPTTGLVYCFDTKVVLEDGAFRVTSWDKNFHSNYDYDPQDRELHFTQSNGIAEYLGYQDNGVNYRMSFYTSYFDLGSTNRTKIVKRIGATIIAPSGQEFIMKLGFDYKSVYTSYPFVLTTGTIFEYNKGEYNISEYSGGLNIQSVKSPAGGSGIVIQAGFEADITGAPLSLQRTDIFVKDGRTI